MTFSNVFTKPISVDVSVLAGGEITGDGNNTGPLSVSNLRADSEDKLGTWTSTGSGFSYAGEPDHVEVHAIAECANGGNNGGKQRIAPMLELWKNGAFLVRSSTGYQRHFTGHNDSSNTIAFTDLNPGVDPVYQIRARQGSNQNDVESVDSGQASFKAVHKVIVSGER